jgi:PBSX family phage terminase large subunit
MLPNYIAPFRPLPWHIAPWRDTSREILLAGPAGTGKSRLAAEKVHAFLLKYPGATGVVVRKTRQSMVNSTVLFLERTIIGRDPRVIHKKAEHRFEYANGSILAYGGMADEEQREQIRGIGINAGVDIVWMEEAVRFTEDDHNEILARMRGKAAPWTQIILSTNPGAPSHWINQKMILGKMAVVYDKATPQDNPYNPKEYIETLNYLTGILRQRLLDGLWVQAEGLVYPEFDHDNIAEITDEPDPRYGIELGADDGYVDPRAILFIQHQPDKIFVFDEIYHSRHLEEVCVSEVVQRCQEITDGWNKNLAANKLLLLRLPDIAIMSPEASALRQHFKKANIPVRGADNDIVLGISTLRSLILDGNGVRILKVHPRCTNLIRELTETYRYPEGSHRDNEKPADGGDHACEALRYWAHTRAKR